jgi:hypothetical protein
MFKCNRGGSEKSVIFWGEAGEGGMAVIVGVTEAPPSLMVAERDRGGESVLASLASEEANSKRWLGKKYIQNQICRSGWLHLSGACFGDDVVLYRRDQR